MDHTAETIARLIRASDEDGEYIASDSEAALLIRLFVSAKIADAEVERNRLEAQRSSSIRDLILADCEAS